MIRRWLHIIKDKDRDIRERLFVLLSSIALIALLLVIIIGFVLGESPTDLLILSLFFVFCTGIVVWSIFLDMIQIGSCIVAAVATIILLPFTYFTGGGIRGGCPMWFFFMAFLICMVIEGYAKWIFLVMDIASAGICYFLEYKNIVIVYGHTEREFYMDSYASLVLICAVVGIMVGFEIHTWREDFKRSKEQAKEIEELSKAQNHFFSSMSHEIRTPINTIIGLNEMILRENVSAEVAEDAANIQSASKLLLHLINDILDMSKFQSGQMQLSPAAYHTGNMLSDIVGMMWGRARDKNLELHIDVSQELPSELYGDEVRIKQILINILNNAIKYTTEGSITFTIQCDKPKDGIVNVIYSVTDTGMGIKKEDIPYLFTAFKRVDEDKNRHIEGTGLGLSIVKSLVDLMGGKINVNSVYTKGSTFVIEIPQQVVNAKEIGRIDLKKGHNVKQKARYHQSFEAPDAEILVVDDNASNLMVVSKLLRDTRVKIDTALSGKEALEKTVEKTYNVILMDHMMPEMDGIECLHKIRNQMGGLNKKTKVVALTANAGSEAQAMYVKEGFDGYLLKPISADDLENGLQKLLPKDMVTIFGDESELIEDGLSWLSDKRGKSMIAVTTESVADLPVKMAEKYNIGVLPHCVLTEDGVFMDGLEIESGGLLAYIAKSDAKVGTSAPDAQVHESFFAERLQNANNVIHIAVSGRIENSGYQAAKEAAEAFDNVTVIDSRHLSSGQGLLVIEACKMAAEGCSVSEIVKRVKDMREYVRTSFIADNLEHLARAGQVSDRIAKVLKAFMLHPVLEMKKGRLTLGGICFGTRERAWDKYIASCLNVAGEIDKSILFITYVGISNRDLEKIKEKALKKVPFEKVYFQKASPAVAVNAGPGTFGLLYKMKM